MTLGDGAAVGVTARLVVVVAAIELLVLGVEAEEVPKNGNCEDDVIGVDSIGVEMKFEELFVAAVIDVLSNVGTPLPLAIVIPLATHCPAYAQYCPAAQHIGPHDVSPNPLGQFNDVAAAAAVMEVCVEVELAAAESRTKEDELAAAETRTEEDELAAAEVRVEEDELAAAETRTWEDD